MDALQVRRSKVNGKFLQDNIGKEITILGEVIKANPDSNTMEIKTTDNCVVNVIMNNQFEETYTGWVEIRGQAQGKNVVIGSHCISFPSHIFKDFGKSTHNSV
ncbi:UNVERIFIED_CONTAM: hypothetical protein PYX00_007789 [Menopon gallinae]|uniref:Replication factor A protein 3 n=1 Tax=Menopon gallinae TaxID=328185 RepID=A0AAW2HL08_9NEOP